MEPLRAPPQSRRAHKGTLARIATQDGGPLRAHSGVLSVPSARVVELESSSVMRTQSSSVVTHGESDRGSRRGRAQTEKQTRHAMDTSSGADPLASREHCEGAAIEAVFGGDDNVDTHDDLQVEWQWGAPSSSDVPSFEVSSWGDEQQYVADLAASVTGAFAAQPLASPSSDVGSKKELDLRECAVHELLSSEKTYVDSLSKLMDCFYRPLTGRNMGSTGSLSRASAASFLSAPLSKSESDTLFGQVEVILLYNTQLYEELNKRINSRSYDSRASKISDIFFKMQSFLQVYVGYAENYGNALKCYGMIMSHNSKSKKLIKEGEKKAGNVLEAFLILPIQRIPRYILLLTEILAHTEPLHPDYDSLREAVARIKELCIALNEAPRKLQEAAELLSVFKSIIPSVPDLLSPGRMLFSKERVWIVQQDIDKVKPRSLFVLNDTLLICRLQGQSNYLRFRINLPNVEVHDTPAMQIDGKVAYVITLESKVKRVVIALKEETTKARIMENIAKYNPTIMHGRAEFVSLADRPGALATSLTASASSLDSSNGGLATSSEPIAPTSVAHQPPVERRSTVSGTLAKSADSSVLGVLSGLLSRKSTSSDPSSKLPRSSTTAEGKTPSLRRASNLRGGKEEDFEIVRKDTETKLAAQSTPPRPPLSEPMSTQSVQQTLIAGLKKKIAQKREEQADLHRLVAFNRKYQDAQGEADAIENIAKYDDEIKELEASIQTVLQSGELPAPKAVKSVKTEGKRKHMRQRSLSTTALPRLSGSEDVVTPVAMEQQGDERGIVIEAEDQEEDDKEQSQRLEPVVVPANPFEDISAIVKDPFSSLVAAAAAVAEGEEDEAAPPADPFATLADPFAALWVEDADKEDASPTSLFVDATPELKSEEQPTADFVPGAWCTALYKFEGANGGELTFKCGDAILLVKTDTQDWFCGQLNGLGTPGWFPCSYVRFGK